MFNLSYSLVCLVAIVRKVEYSSTKATYTIEDHTGRIEAHYWLDDEGGKQPKVTQNAYARIIGGLRKAGDQNVVIIYHAEEVEKINEVTTHLLEILFSRFKAEQFSKGGAVLKGMSYGSDGLSSQNGNGNVPMETMDTTAAPHGMTGMNALIYQAISANNMGNKGAGISREDLYEKYPKFPKTEIDNILQYLVQEGHTYSTVSIDNFKTVE